MRKITPRIVLVVAVAAAVAAGTVAAQGEGDHTSGDESGSLAYFTGHDSTVTDAFEAGGLWEVALGAWCFEAVGWVDVRVVADDGTVVGEVQVLGEGVERLVLETPAGSYHLEVDVSHLHVYTWEVLIMPLAVDADAGAAPTPPETVVALPNDWWGEHVDVTDAFEVDGPLEVSLGAYCHAGFSFVTAVFYTLEGEVAGYVRVIGEGVVTERLELEPGTYFVHVTSPTMEEYSWELAVEGAADR